MQICGCIFQFERVLIVFKMLMPKVNSLPRVKLNFHVNGKENNRSHKNWVLTFKGDLNKYLLSF